MTKPIGWPERELDGTPYGNCPVQAHGLWGGRLWYFRARGDSWSWECPEIDYAKPLPEPFWFAEGDWWNSGWMESEDAAALIARALGWAKANESGGRTDLTAPTDPWPRTEAEISAERERVAKNLQEFLNFMRKHSIGDKENANG